MPVVMFNAERRASSGVLFSGRGGFDPTPNFKYAPIEQVRVASSDFVNAILDQMPIRGRHKRILVDVKVQQLTPDTCSCIPGWHCDGPLDPTHKSLPEVHHLFTLGGAPTEFVGEPLMLRWEAGYSLKDLQDQIPADVETYTITPGTITTFGRHDFHRGVHASRPLTRLLIRVTETDVILPNKGSFIPVGG